MSIQTFVISQLQNVKDNVYNLSEIVFSKSTKAPPQMKRMFFVSICNARQMTSKSECFSFAVTPNRSVPYFFIYKIQLTRNQNQTVSKTCWHQNLSSQLIQFSLRFGPNKPTSKIKIQNPKINDQNQQQNHKNQLPSGHLVHLQAAAWRSCRAWWSSDGDAARRSGVGDRARHAAILWQRQPQLWREERCRPPVLTLTGKHTWAAREEQAMCVLDGEMLRGSCGLD